MALRPLVARFQTICRSWFSSASTHTGPVGHGHLDAMVRQGFGTGSQQRGGVLHRAARVDPGHGDVARAGVGEERRDGAVQPVGLAQHDVHQLCLLGRERQFAAQHLHGPRHRGQGIADLVSDAGGHLAHRGQALAHLGRALEALDGGDVLEGEDEAQLAVPERQRRGAHAQFDRPAVGAVIGVVDATGAGIAVAGAGPGRTSRGVAGRRTPASPTHRCSSR